MALKPKVLGIAGSPRRGGDTNFLLQEAMLGAGRQGAETKIVIIDELNIAPCRHCDKRLPTGKCAVVAQSTGQFCLIHQATTKIWGVKTLQNARI